jgi:hypothetical protein
MDTDGHGFLTAKHAKYTKYFDANSANFRESDFAAKERKERIKITLPFLYQAQG